MSLDALLEPAPQKTKQPCAVGRIVLELEDPYKTALVALLSKAYRDGGESDESIHGRLTKAGFKVGATVIHRHRKNVCNCGAAGE